MTNRSIGAFIRRTRKNKGWSLADLSEKSGVNQSTLSRLEQGKRKPALELIGNVARAFGHTAGDFIKKAEAGR